MHDLLSSKELGQFLAFNGKSLLKILVNLLSYNAMKYSTVYYHRLVFHDML